MVEIASDDDEAMNIAVGIGSAGWIVGNSHQLMEWQQSVVVVHKWLSGRKAVCTWLHLTMQTTWTIVVLQCETPWVNTYCVLAHLVERHWVCATAGVKWVNFDCEGWP